MMRSYALPFEDRDIINDPEHRQELIQKRNQTLQPCVEIDGKMLADVSGEEVEAYLLANSLVGVSEEEADAPTNSSSSKKSSNTSLKKRLLRKNSSLTYPRRERSLATRYYGWLDSSFRYFRVRCTGRKILAPQKTTKMDIQGFPGNDLYITIGLVVDCGGKSCLLKRATGLNSNWLKQHER